MILASRGVQFQEVLVPTPVRAPLEAVVEEAEVSGAVASCAGHWWWMMAGMGGAGER